MIDIENISKAYAMGAQQVTALNGVTLSVDKGEYIAIVGPSGSGKSTLMNIIGCLDTPDTGLYKLNDIDVSHMGDDELARVRNKQIGFVFQQFNLLARTPAIKQVALPLMYAGVGRRERFERAEAMLAAVGLGDRIHHRPDELSGGQQQRVAIARALVAEPSILLADEPTGNLDSASGAEVMDILDKLHERGMTIIAVTHSSDVASHTARTVTLRDGLIVTDQRQPKKNGKDKVPASGKKVGSKQDPQAGDRLDPAAAPGS
jgi:putative ABC transport system ATP-binding protein